MSYLNKLKQHRKSLLLKADLKDEREIFKPSKHHGIERENSVIMLEFFNIVTPSFKSIIFGMGWGANSSNVRMRKPGKGN